MLLGVRAVIAESFERIHRSNLIGMGVLPLQFQPGSERPVARADRARELSRSRGFEQGDARVAQVIARGDSGASPSASRCACASIRRRSASTSAMAASCSTCCGSSPASRAQPEGSAGRERGAASPYSISMAPSRDTTRCCRSCSATCGVTRGACRASLWRCPRRCASCSTATAGRSRAASSTPRSAAASRSSLQRWTRAVRAAVCCGGV